MQLPDVLKWIHERDAILCLSVQHTGTWFLLHFLAQHPDTTGITLMRNISIPEEVPRRGIVHVHFGKKGINCQSGLQSESFNELAEQIGGMKVVVPVRDPLLSLISRQERHPDLDHTYIVKGFTGLGKLRATFIPVDLNRDRKELLTGVLNEAGLGWAKYADDWVTSWPRKNSRKDYPLMDLYKKGDLGAIRKQIPMSLALLQSKESEIRPFLESQGYENLMWWT